MIPHKGYLEANFIIPGLPQYNEDMSFLVTLGNKYGERELVQLGTLVIDHLIVTMTKEDYSRLGIPENRYT